MTVFCFFHIYKYYSREATVENFYCKCDYFHFVSMLLASQALLLSGDFYSILDQKYLLLFKFISSPLSSFFCFFSALGTLRWLSWSHFSMAGSSCNESLLLFVGWIYWSRDRRGFDANVLLDFTTKLLKARSTYNPLWGPTEMGCWEDILTDK